MKRQTLIVLIIIFIFSITVGCSTHNDLESESDKPEQMEESHVDMDDHKEDIVTDTETEEEADNKEELETTNDHETKPIADDKILSFLSKTKQELIDKVGEPDEEDWWSGPYIYYDNLDINNSDGFIGADSSMIWLNDNDEVVQLTITSFKDIEIGMSFNEILDKLDDTLEVIEHEFGSEFGAAAMEYKVGSYVFEFSSWWYEKGKDQPVDTIYVTYRED